MNKKIISLGLAGVVLASSAAVLAKNINNNHTTIEMTQTKFKKINIENKILDTKNESGEVNISIPQFKGLTDKTFEEKLNKDIENNASKKVNEYNNKIKESKNIESVATDSVLKIDYEIKSNSYISSIIVNTYMITPGEANGEISRDIYNIDVENNKLLKINDLFKPNTNYKELINSSIKNEISKNKDAYFSIEKTNQSSEIDGFKSIDDDTKFFISNVGDLIITFDLYEIAPRSTGTPEFLIPNSDIKTILIKENLSDSLIRTKQIKPNSSQDVSIFIPEIFGLKNSNFEKELNEKIKNNIDNDYKNFEIKANDRKGNLSSFYVNYELYLENENYLSFKVSTYNYLGGDANGENKSSYYNIDTKNGKELILKDLFKENSNYKDIINKEIKTQIDKDKNAYHQDEFGFQSISENQNYHFDEFGNIVISFEQYEIAPRSTGAPEFKIDNSLLKDIIK